VGALEGPAFVAGCFFTARVPQNRIREKKKKKHNTSAHFRTALTTGEYTGSVLAPLKGGVQHPPASAAS
jgi:hypothetical protein